MSLPSDNNQLGPALVAYGRSLTAAGRRPETVRMRLQVVRSMHRAGGVALVGSLTTDQVLDYLSRPLAASSRRQYVTSWRAWCAFTGQPCELVTPRVPRGLPRPARAAQLAAAQLAAPDPVSAWIACGRWAGLRAAEVAGLTGDDVDVAAGVLYVDGKGGQRAAVPLHSRLAAVLEPYLAGAGGGPLWPGTGSRHVSRRAGAVLREHGAADRFHQLRHYYGTAVYRASKDLLKAQRALRHASPATTTIYAQLADDDLAAAIELVP